MPELNFKGKEFVYNHHLTVPFRPLEIQADKGVGAPSLDGNLIIHGDNLHALKALLPMYAGKVDCVYIDPPYNTGKDGWSYNDRVNSPMMQEWLASNPITLEDGLRHEKWLCMMWPRLCLIKELMKPGATIFISIDDNEAASLKMVLNELFGDIGFLGTIVWKNATDNNPTNIAVEHEYIHAFAYKRDELEPVWKSPWSDTKEAMLKIEQELLGADEAIEVVRERYARWFRAHRAQLAPLQEYDQIDEDGIFTGSRSVHNPGKEGYRWELMNPKTGTPVPQPLMGYRFPESTRDQLLADDKIIFSENPNNLIQIKVYLKEYREKMPGVVDIDGRRGANELRALFPERKQAFKNPKTFTLIEWLLSFATKPDSIVLDSFAGSGTTGHAVLELNKRDGGNRKFILVEGEPYADDLTAERVKRVASGVPNAATEPLKSGIGGSFTYCTLGDAIDMDGLLTGQDLPSVESLAALLYHTATAKAFDTAALTPAPEIGEAVMRLGTANGRHLWLIYKPDLEWLKSADAALTLSRARAIVASAAGDHLVFAPAKFVSRELLAQERLPVEYAPLPFALYRVETA
ncbi:site-specific DNA-methyltransferase [Sphingopyxis granuli]|uniref:site-specific DNA-methyltransferase n=1 Tax=Sphingopyxis granuli TaxID=267128 RepID=UPI001F52EE8F|nr:site-specific DNA-methyltransferase [Sphingopyxis granuli]UNK78823.1 site-specific DNA-methyltransferase [Sphingopyxis granuli]